jgi:hypothetical protein
MKCKRCNDLGWIITERNGISGARLCNCRAEAQQPAGPSLREDDAALLVEGLCEVLGFAPETEVGRAVIVNALTAMCSTRKQAELVVNRACALYTKWPDCGIRGLRQILCAHSTPKDGITVMSTAAYPDGVPLLKKTDPYVPGRLPPGRTASGDLELERAVLNLGELKKLK